MFRDSRLDFSLVADIAGQNPVATAIRELQRENRSILVSTTDIFDPDPLHTLSWTELLHLAEYLFFFEE